MDSARKSPHPFPGFTTLELKRYLAEFDAARKQGSVGASEQAVVEQMGRMRAEVARREAVAGSAAQRAAEWNKSHR
jgi:hypothetical protein